MAKKPDSTADNILEKMAEVRRVKDITSAQGKPKYLHILDTLREEVRHLSVGHKLPGDVELGRRFGTSRLTVIRALRELVSENLVERRAGAGTFVGRVRDRQDAAATRHFGLLIPDLGEGEIFEPICQGMARAPECSHQALMWGKTSSHAKNKNQQAEELCRYFISRHVAGVFFAPVELVSHKDETNIRIASELEQAGIPVVLLDRCIFEFPNRSRHDLVGIDNRRESFRVTDYLLGLGCQRVGFVARPSSAPTVLGRLAGWREALAGRAIEIDREWPLWVDPCDVLAVKKWFRACRLDGIVCANDLTAAHLMQTLLGLGVDIPSEVRIVGFDDVKYASLLPVPLTTLRQPCQEIGAAAMAAMLERLAKPDMATRDILLGCELIVRQSCGARSDSLK